jgi:uncharacterized protein
VEQSPVCEADRGGLEILDEPACLALLASGAVGRLGLSRAALPVIVPVNFVVDDHTIVVCTEAGLKLDAARSGNVACLEIDGSDERRGSGWSVLATGRLHEITEPAGQRRAEQLPLAPWAVGGTRHYVGLSIELLSGRRVHRR